ncbi:MAG: hypothetical protein H7A24_06695 [Leptospiraceae bacterium]|nr:hypothetical protein [Leptospiraceae bacterium]MCP5511550.1 hypothetical protein [Leptospiraceae bacterium]
MRDWNSILFCGSFDGETDLIQKVRGLNVYNVGIGFHDSLYNLQRFLLKNPDRYKSIVFLGSAGSYDQNVFQIGDIVYSYKFLNKDIAEIKNFAKVPDVITKHIISIPDNVSLSMVQKLQYKEAITNSMNYVTLIDLTKEEKLEHLFDVGVENMEAFSIAYIANRLSLSFIAIYFITNIVGTQGSIDWAGNWRAGSNRLQGQIIEYMNKKSKK